MLQASFFHIRRLFHESSTRYILPSKGCECEDVKKTFWRGFFAGHHAGITKYRKEGFEATMCCIKVEMKNGSVCW